MVLTLAAITNTREAHLRVLFASLMIATSTPLVVHCADPKGFDRWGSREQPYGKNYTLGAHFGINKAWVNFALEYFAYAIDKWSSHKSAQKWWQD